MLKAVLINIVKKIKTFVIFLEKIKSLKILKNRYSDYYGEVGYACPRCKHPNSYRKMVCEKCDKPLRCNHCFSILILPSEACAYCDRNI